MICGLIGQNNKSKLNESNLPKRMYYILHTINDN